MVVFIECLFIRRMPYLLNIPTDYELETRLTILKAGVELSQIKNELQLLLSCIEYFNYQFVEFNDLKKFHSDLQQSDPLLFQCSSKLTSLYTITGIFTASLLEIFEHVKNSSFVVDFFSSLNDFQHKYDMLLARQQGYKYGMKKLGIVLAVYRLLEPFVVRQKGLFF